MAQVKCKYCGKSFNRDKIAYVIPSARRYGHAECYLRARAIDENIPELEITDPADIVKCCVCGNELNKKKDKYTQLSNGKYAHLGCAEIEAKREKTDSEKLDIFIMKLFNWTYVPPRVKRQIQNFIKDYDFSYSGIYKSLEYFFIVKGNSIEKANGGIGIVPYVYKDAYNYYYALWEAQQKNQNIVINTYIPQVKEIIIPTPECRIKKRHLFSFLDSDIEEVDNEQ